MKKDKKYKSNVKIIITIEMFQKFKINRPITRKL